MHLTRMRVIHASVVVGALLLGSAAFFGLGYLMGMATPPGNPNPPVIVAGPMAVFGAAVTSFFAFLPWAGEGDPVFTRLARHVAARTTRHH